jgi:hypothetical protein
MYGTNIFWLLWQKIALAGAFVTTYSKADKMQTDGKFVCYFTLNIRTTVKLFDENY